MRRVKFVVLPLVLLVGTVAVGQDRSSSSRSDRYRSDRSDRGSRSDRYRSSGSSSRSPSNRGSAVIETESGPTTKPVTFLEAYRLVLDRNIFSKNRVAYREPGTGPTTQQSPTFGHSELALRLTGVTIEPGQIATASVEDQRVSRATLYKVGDTFLDGKVTAIRLDGMEYTRPDGTVVKVDLGSPVQGGPTYFVSSGGSGGGSYTGGPTGAPGSAFGGGTPSGGASAPSTGGGDTSDILEKLRQRRLQETKK